MKTKRTFCSIFDAPWGAIGIITDKESLIAIKTINIPTSSEYYPRQLHNTIKKQFRDYFQGKAKSFMLPIKLSGTVFQTEVWKACANIHYGETVSYQQLATIAKHPGAARAIGTALGKNPLPIIIPCHRIIKADGHIGNYTGPEGVKSWLLRHEAKHQALTGG